MAQITTKERERRKKLAGKGLKWCPTCSTAKSFAEFHRKKSARDGYRCQCRECEYTARKKWNEANQDHIRKRSKKRYWKDPEKAREQKRKDYYRHRVKRIKAVGEQTDPERKRAYDQEYRSRPEVQARKRELQRLYKNQQREKYRAHYYVKNAIRDGRLVRQPCEICGDPKGEAHHDDYSKPLDVRWLCRAHHRATHARYT